MKILSIFLSLIPLLAFTACTHTPTPAAGDYTVSQINGTPVQIAEPIRVTYTGERLAGKGPINNWSLPVAADGSLGLGIVTRMAGPEKLMELENTLLKALDGGTLSALPDGSLVVTKGGTDVVVMPRAPIR